MACRTAKVQRVADKTVKAKEQIEKLEAMIIAQEGAHKARFFSKIESHLSDAQITDPRQIDYNSAIKTEYTSQFSLDKIAEVVTSSLKAAIKAMDPTVVQPATSPEAIEAYVDVVNTVAQAAKSSSQSATSLSFSMNRLSPGVFAFLYASSTNIEDNETFGNEAVTTTAIYYRVIQSIDDIKHQAKFDAALINKKNYLHMKALQAALTDELGEGKIDINTWMELDRQYSEAVARLKARLSEDQLKEAQQLVAAKNGLASDIPNEQLVRNAIEKISKMGATHAVALEKSKERIANAYF